LTITSNEHNLKDEITAYEFAFMRHRSGLLSIQEYLTAKANKPQVEFELEQSRSMGESVCAALANAAGVKASTDVLVLRPVIPPNIFDIAEVDGKGAA
jgi:hypothetical protein